MERDGNLPGYWKNHRTECHGDHGAKRVFEKFYLEASRLSMRRMAARSMKASEVWTFNS